MSIKTTQNITRESAIERITFIYEIIKDKDYRKLSEEASEYLDTFKFIDNFSPEYNINEIIKWDDKMLGDFMDQPFFRFSMFDNYLVV